MCVCVCLCVITQVNTSVRLMSTIDQLRTVSVVKSACSSVKQIKHAANSKWTPTKGMIADLVVIIVQIQKKLIPLKSNHNLFYL